MSQPTPNGGAGRLLMVAQHPFQLGWMGDTARLLDLAGGLSRRGWEVSLLAGRRAPRSAPPRPESFFPGRVFRPSLSDGPWPLVMDRRLLRTLWRPWWLLHRWRSFLVEDAVNGWPARVARWQQTEGALARPDVIWGVSTGRLSGLAAATRLGHQLACPVVLELHDPVPIPGLRLTASQQVTLDSCLGSAAAVVTTTEALADHLQDRYPGCRGKVHPVRLGFRGEMASSPAPPGGPRLTLLHAGHLPGKTGRNARGLVSGLAAAFAREPASRGAVDLVLVGAGPGLREAARQARRLGLEHSVQIRGQVSLEESTRMIARADVLVVVKYSDPAYGLLIPGKLFQYLPHGKPILALMGECEAARLLRATGLGVVVPPDDGEAIGAGLVQLWNSRLAPGRGCHPNWQVIAEHSADRMVDRVEAILSALLPPGRGRR